MTKFDLDKETIRELAALLEETGLTEMEYEWRGRRLRLSRQSGGIAVTSAPAPAISGEKKSAKGGDPAGAAIDASHPGAVAAPMVGTVYLQAEPGATPFVQLGDKVAPGQTLLIIEAMKTMNPVRAHRAGTVARLLVDDTQPVEYGDVLMILE